MKKIFTALSAYSLCLLPLSITAQAAQSIIDVTLLEAPNDTDYKVGNVYQAYVSYHLSNLSGQGSETIASDGIISLQFEFNGSIYDKSHDEASGYPQLHFSDGELVGIDYWNTQGLSDGDANSFFTFYQDNTFLYSPYGESEYSGEYTVSSVPEPNPAIILISSFGWLLIIRHRSA